MGFVVDMAELIALRDYYMEHAATAESELDNAKAGMNGIITSNSMYGEVGKAINNEINNSHNAIIVGLKNTYTLMGVDFQTTLGDLQTAIGETSESAVLKEDVLTETKKKLDEAGIKQGEFATAFDQIYNEIKDLIGLSSPVSSVPAELTASGKILQDAIDKTNAFNGMLRESSTADLLGALQNQIDAGKKAQGLSYTDPIFTEFAAYTNLADGVQELDQKIAEAKAEAQRQAEEEAQKAHEEWAKNHPAQAWLEDIRQKAGNWWDGVKEGTKNLDIPVVEEVLLFGEGMLGAAGDFVSSTAIAALDLNQFCRETMFVNIERVTGLNFTPQWMKDEVAEGWDTVFNFVNPAPLFNLVTDEKARNQAVQHFQDFIKSVPERANSAWNNFLEDPWYSAGGLTFDVGSLFVGAGEIKAGVTAAKGAKGFLQGAKAFGKGAGQSVLKNFDNFAVRAANLYKNGGKTIRNFFNKSLDKMASIGDDVAQQFQKLFNRADELALAGLPGFKGASNFTKHNATVYNMGGKGSGKGSRRARQEFSEKTASKTADRSKAASQGGKAKDLIGEDGVFKDKALEEKYQNYLKRKTKAGQTPRDRADWKEASDYWSKESPVARGNRFNEKARESGVYSYHEVHLSNGKRLDSYDPVKGEIISRKATDLDKISEDTFIGYLTELKAKYAPGTVIRSDKYPDLNGQKLKGDLILEIPASNADLENIQHFKDIAKKYGVDLRFMEE